ncbi:MAG TPA: hypothetical protein VJR92_00480 [Gemmatimonadaceae bacterium]|nr:hypothetical protein [Gemmatimonadaceae bacterium]
MPILTFVLAACSDQGAELPTATARLATSAAAAAKVAICHVAGANPLVLDVASPALADHFDHGDYAVTLFVNRESNQANDGIHFTRITDALNAARTGRVARGELTSAACRVTILVSSGVYPGATGTAAPDIERFPLMVDVPDITLQGAFAMDIDANGRATGANTASGATTLSPIAPLPVVAGASTPIIAANGHPDGSAGHGLIVQGFVFLSGHTPPTSLGGQGVFTVRVDGVTIRGNRFEAGFSDKVDVRAGSADVSQNYLTGAVTACDICVAAPGRFRATGNLIEAGGIPGIVASGTIGLPVAPGVEPYPLPSAAEAWAEFRNNEVRNHLRVPVGVGLRVDAQGNAAPNVHNTIHATFQDNVLTNNRFGIIVHGAFPVAGSALRSDVDVTLGGNVFAQTCQTKLLVSLSRHTAALGLSTNPFLMNSTFRLTLNGDVSWDEAWYGHPAGLGNSLIVDDQLIDNGFRHSYSATTCPGL